MYGQKFRFHYIELQRPVFTQMNRNTIVHKFFHLLQYHLFNAMPHLRCTCNTIIWNYHQHTLALHIELLNSIEYVDGFFGGCIQIVQFIDWTQIAIDTKLFDIGRGDDCYVFSVAPLKYTKNALMTNVYNGIGLKYSRRTKERDKLMLLGI